MQKASNNLFVVHAKSDRRKVQEALKDFGKVEEVKGSDHLLLVHSPTDNPAKKTWRSIKKKLGKGESVHPVLIDETGRHQYPTGEINVRFERTPSDAQLKKFAAAHNLRLHSRNEFVPQQAIFEPVEAGDRYVLELVKEIQNDKNIQLAWPNTLSRYERAK